MNNWFDRILLHTRTQPETPAIVMEDRVVTYGMLGTTIDNCARRLVGAHIDKNNVVAIMVQNPIRDLTLCLALFRIGMRSMSLESGHLGIAGLKFATVLSDAKSKQWLNPAGRIIETDSWFGPEPVGGDDLPAPFSNSRQICREALTSGSTGAPKSIKATVAYIARYVGPGVMEQNSNLVLCMLGLSSVWGYAIACAALASRRTLCFAESPFQAIRMIELFSIDFVFASTDQLVSLIRAVRKSGAHVKSLRTVVTGGSVPTRALLEAATIHFCKNVLCRYGTSEIGSFAEAGASAILSQPGLVGDIQPEFELAVFDRSGDRCDPGQVGVLKSRVRSGAGGEPEAWTDNGDVGWITADGRLFVVGRTADIDDLSDASVRDISPVYEVEHLLRLEWDASDAAAVMVDGNTVKPEIWVATVDCKDADVQKLQTILRQRGIEGVVRLFPLTSIPRGANGKVQRAQLRSLMLNAAALSKF